MPPRRLHVEVAFEPGGGETVIFGWPVGFIICPPLDLLEGRHDAVRPLYVPGLCRGCEWAASLFVVSPSYVIIILWNGWHFFFLNYPPGPASA